MHVLDVNDKCGYFNYRAGGGGSGAEFEEGRCERGRGAGAVLVVDGGSAGGRNDVQDLQREVTELKRQRQHDETHPKCCTSTRTLLYTWFAQNGPEIRPARFMYYRNSTTEKSRCN